LTLDEVKGNIDFRHVSFKYPTRPDIQIFSDFTLHIPSGKVSLLLITSLYLPGSCKQNLTFVMVLYRLLHLLERVVAASQQ
jgi:ABC-type multidrug transport system fused ATPase/permease subunit